MRSLFKTFLQGLVVVAPAIITVYVCGQAIIWLDGTIRSAIQATGFDIPGVGVFVAFAGIYLTGLLTRHWFFRGIVSLGESIVERIPLVKSLYSAIKDLLQFLSGTDARTRGRPARVHLLDGRVHMLGLITQRQPETFMGDKDKGRTAVYLPMSYQIGGFTVYVPSDQIEELPDLSVEDVLKLSMTAGVSSTGDRSVSSPGPPAHASSPENQPQE